MAQSAFAISLVGGRGPFTLTDGVYRASHAVPGTGLGGPGIVPANAVGEVTMRIKSQPTWGRAAVQTKDDEFSLLAHYPPFADMKGTIVVEATDSTTPTPRKAELAVEVECPLPSGQLVYRSDDANAIRFAEDDWPIMLEGRYTASRATADIVVRQNVTDDRIIVFGTITDRYGGKHVEAVVDGPHWQASEICRKLGGSFNSCASEIADGLKAFAKSAAPPVLVA